jgi:hypothetical protein
MVSECPSINPLTWNPNEEVTGYYFASVTLEASNSNV